MHVYEGIVEPGDRRGRTLGFPTANISITAPPDTDGVWAGLVETGPDTFAIAAVSIGRRPTFYAQEVIVCSKHTFWTPPRTFTDSASVSISSNVCAAKRRFLVWKPWWSSCIWMSGEHASGRCGTIHGLSLLHQSTLRWGPKREPAGIASLVGCPARGHFFGNGAAQRCAADESCRTRPTHRA